MSRQLVRVSFVIITLAVVAASVYRIFLSEQQIAADRQAERAFSVTAWRVGLALGELRAAQQAYVAAGQDRAYWVEKVSLHQLRITTDLGYLSGLSTTPGATDALAEAEASVERLKQIDELAREHSASGRDLLASDLIFTDGLELAAGAARHLEVARIGERDAYQLVRQSHRHSQLSMLGAALGTSLLVTILLAPAGWRQLARPDGALPESNAQPTVSDGEILGSELDTPDLGLNRPTGFLALGEASSIPKTPVPDLGRTADLCTDLGRLIATDELPDVLDRAADLLHATGIIIWVRDESGEALRPAAGHGYSPDALTRIGAIRCGGDNATVEAYRTARLQVVRGSAETLGAIAAPLLSPDGCIGVMSAEVREAYETSEAIQATTAILAAQLSTLVTADPPAEAQRVQG